MRASAVLCGIGSWLPPNVVTNADLSRILDTSDDWIRSRTGIRERRVAAPGTSTGDMAVEAGGRALKSAGTDHVDLVILATTTPDHRCPATAPEVAYRLDLGGVPALDLAAVCSGFVYGLAAAAGFIAAGIALRVLLIGSDTFTTILDPADRGTRAVFGDGAGAAVLRAGRSDEPGAIGAFALGSDGSIRELMTVPAGGSRRPVAVETAQKDRYFTMQGPAVFRHAVTRMASSATEACEKAGWTPGEVECLIAHQANYRILQAVARRLGIPIDRCAVNIDRVGNTAAASIPLALADAATSGLLAPGKRVLLTAFGGGATWGSAAMTWPDITPETG